MNATICHNKKHINIIIIITDPDLTFEKYKKSLTHSCYLISRKNNKITEAKPHNKNLSEQTLACHMRTKLVQI